MSLYPEPKPSAGPAIKGYLAACLAFSFMVGLISPILGSGNDHHGSLIPVAGGVAMGLAMTPGVIIFALPGFMLARLVLELLGARSVGSFMLAGALAPYIYIAGIVLIDIAGGRFKVLEEIPGPLEFVLGAIPGATAGFVYFLVRFGPLGPPRRVVEEQD